MRTLATLLVYFSIGVSLLPSQTTLPFDNPRFLGGATALGDLAIFAGGAYSGLVPASEVNIYNRTNGQSSGANLSEGRTLICGISSTERAYFAGGLDPRSGGNATATVDIYHAATESWNTQSLTAPRGHIMGVSADSLLFFAGGLATTTGFFEQLTGVDVIDVYHEASETWSTLNLSEARGAGAAVKVGDYLIFAGGLVNEGLASKRVDIYNLNTGEWQVDSLSSARFWLSGVSDGEYAYFGGGMDVDNTHYTTVDIYHPTTGTWQTTDLSLGRVGMSAGFSCGQVIFAGGADLNWNTRFITQASDVIDTYDPLSRQWSSSILDVPRYGSLAAAFDDEFIIASGFSNTRVSTLIAYDCAVLVNTSNLQAEATILLSPNPIQSQQLLRFSQSTIPLPTDLSVQLIGATGQQVRANLVVNNGTVQLPALPPGLYLLQISSQQEVINQITKLLVH